MTDTEPVAPAAKLRKVIEGDVTVASVNQDITPEAKATMTTAKQVAAGIGEQPTAPPAAASQMDGGKKRKVALYVAYIGAGYHGMQRNPGYPSIEGELEKAICKAGGISEANADSFTKINWMRAARTDKGVSAVGQIVSLKMVIGHTNYDVIESINKHLPDQIKVLGYTKTTAGFDARKLCDKRQYEYVLPVWAFDPTACRGRLCVEEAELRSAANLTLANGALPPCDQRTTADQTTQTQQAAATDTIAEATAVAVAAQADTNGDTTLSEQPQAHSSAAADLPQPSQATEALHAASDVPAQISPAQGASNGPAQGISDNPAPQHAPGSQVDSIQPPSPAPAQNASAQSGPAQGVLCNPAPSNGPAGGSEPSKAGFVFDDAAARKLTSILRQYEGTHNFHNFTVRLDATDPSAKRYMLSCKCTGVFEIQGEQWVRIVIIGQSFMLHQIRKMVGMALAIMRGDAPPNCIKVALQPKRSVPTPMAPEIGLFLDECYYEAYNTRWGADHEPVTLSQFKDRVATFKAELMYPHIANTDAKASINATWLRTLTNRSYHFDQWADEKSFKAAVGPRGEKAIFNGDILPSPAGAASIVGGHESYGLARWSAGREWDETASRGRGRGGYRGRAGEKRPRNLERLMKAPGEQGTTSVVDISVEHEYSD